MLRSGPGPAAELARAAQQELIEFSRVIICDAAGAVLHASFEVRICGLCTPLQQLHSFCTVRQVSHASVRFDLSQDIKQRDVQSLPAVMGERESAIRNGFSIQGRQYEVSAGIPRI